MLVLHNASGRYPRPRDGTHCIHLSAVEYPKISSLTCKQPQFSLRGTNYTLTVIDFHEGNNLSASSSAKSAVGRSTMELPTQLDSVKHEGRKVCFAVLETRETSDGLISSTLPSLAAQSISHVSAAHRTIVSKPVSTPSSSAHFMLPQASCPESIKAVESTEPIATGYDDRKKFEHPCPMIAIASGVPMMQSESKPIAPCPDTSQRSGFHGPPAFKGPNLPGVTSIPEPFTHQSYISSPASHRADMQQDLEHPTLAIPNTLPASIEVPKTELRLRPLQTSTSESTAPAWEPQPTSVACPGDYSITESMNGLHTSPRVPMMETQSLQRLHPSTPEPLAHVKDAQPPGAPCPSGRRAPSNHCSAIVAYTGVSNGGRGDIVECVEEGAIFVSSVARNNTCSPLELPTLSSKEADGCLGRIHASFTSGTTNPGKLQQTPRNESKIVPYSETIEILPATCTNFKRCSAQMTQDGRNPAAALNTDRDHGDRSADWVVISTEQAEQAARKLQLEAERNRVLENTIKKHKKERVIIFDAAMKQAEKQKTEDIGEAKQAFERQKSAMRMELDQELRKVDGLYEERCRDYAQMVSDDCEAEVSKAVSDMRKDWTRQKKTIAQLVRDGGGERQVAVIARAVMEQFAEERENEINAIRADIYAELKAEFEQREVAMKNALQNEHSADLEGQMLLAEIRHQKELEKLRNEPSRNDLGTGVTVHRPRVTPEGNCTVAIGSNTVRSSTLSSSPETMPQEETHVSVHMDSYAKSRKIGRGERRGLVGKLPIFKTPTQRIVHHGQSRAETPILSSGTKYVSQPGARMKKTSRLATGSARSSDARTEGRDSRYKADNVANDFDQGITTALVVSPTKSTQAVPTIELSVKQVNFCTFSRSSYESPGPKKKGKKSLPPTP